jgi:hypothetical protein
MSPGVLQVPKVALTEKFVAGVKAGPSQIDYFDAKTKGTGVKGLSVGF